MCFVYGRYSLEYHFLARLYESTGGAIAVTPASVLASALALLKMLKFLVKKLGDLEVKVMDLEILC